jgi:polyphosphate glucokinase
MSDRRVGIDVGGSSIKAALVDVTTGAMIGESQSVQTPRPATVAPMIEAFVEIDGRLGGAGSVGLAMPSVVQHGVVRTAANIDKSWIGVDVAALLRQRLQRPVVVLNDADAAGYAEVRWGAGRGSTGTVIVLTFGTGIGSAIFLDGHLLPNTEFGHMELLGADAELHASARVRTEEHLDWPAWAERVNLYLERMHALFWPDLFILGGAVSQNFAAFGPLLKSPAQIRPAQFAGQAGVIGAALAAANLAR